MTPGQIGICHSGTPAYYPVAALIERGAATQLGELYDARGHVLTFMVGEGKEQVFEALEALYARAPEDPRRITIGREFFITALKDYDDWPLKWWREAVQNAVDAGAQNVALGAMKNPDETHTVFCDDDAAGMDEDTLINKFLVLGGTTKVGAGGAAGGFGKAKELLLLPWISWKIHTRDIIVEGSGIDYTVKKGFDRRGTRLEVVMPPDKTTDGAIARGFLEKCNLPHVRFTVDGSPVRAALSADQPVESVPGKVDVFFVKSDRKQSYIYIRTKGIFMFQRYVGEVPGFIIAELTAPSIEILTANRDGFRDYDTGRTIDRLAERIAKDTMSALRSSKGLVRKKYQGTGKFRSKARASSILESIGPHVATSIDAQSMGQITARLSDYAQGEETKLSSVPNRQIAEAMLDHKFAGPSHVEAAIEQLVWEPDFYVFNDIEGYKVPKKFFPETMSPTVLKLAKTWVELCRFVLIQLGSDVKFGVGFIFSQQTAAAAITDREHVESGEEKWLMLNPLKDYEHYEKSDVWHASQDADLKWLYAAAIHEATHIADHISYHDESFASALTRNIAKCADGYRKIKQIVAGIKMRGGPESD